MQGVKLLCGRTCFSKWGGVSLNPSVQWEHIHVIAGYSRSNEYLAGATCDKSTLSGTPSRNRLAADVEDEDLGSWVCGERLFLSQVS
jgi:hypothetical protein